MNRQPRSLPAFYDPGFAAPIGDHIMPIGKFALVAEGARAIPGVHVARPRPCEREQLLRAHTPEYVEAVRSGHPRALAESQKFPWSPQLYESVCLTNGAVIEAGAAAIDRGVAAAIASGFHHAHADHGEGFCTFNGLVVAAEHLRQARQAQNVAILDLDLHYGNGTASLVSSRPWMRALSLYGNDYANNEPFRDVTTLRHEDGPNHRSAPLPAGCRLPELLKVLDAHLGWLVEDRRPDLLFFQAGADPFREDPYSPLDLGIEDLKVRDERVFQWAKDERLPVAWVLAGGYTRDISKVVAIHLNTFHAARSVHL
ncbi:MAG: histone deacetylase [Verrucomicrobia bacterium]|nr:histone deacetylase [Verrucomicrobiota bacterium]MBI3870204.1 histone deacetylase [Verrucomicrobiota bacterium]